MDTTTTTQDTARLTWWVYPLSTFAVHERMRYESTMRGTWGWDATCNACGWDSRTGGAVKRHVEDKAYSHLYTVHGVRRGVYRYLPAK